MQKINPFLWFDDNAEEAANFYTSVFKDSKIKTTTKYSEESAEASGRPKGSVMTVAFDLYGQPFVAINGGPIFKINPSISFFVNCKTETEVEELWNKLSNGGKILMALDKYPFSEKYGWLEDKFGVSWQIIIFRGEAEQKIIPSLMFTKNVTGKAEEAINFYTSVFKHAKPGSFFRFEEGQKPDKDSSIAYADFTLEGQKFAAMDGGHMHDFSFNEAISFVVNCDNQKELDHFWNKLSAVPQAEMCGWLKDKYGLSWQIVPTALGELLSNKESGKSQRVMQAVLQMKKLDIETLKNA
jgi:predicted 3-demethylubiquinone-9 3-methyltransferase (glyoxalase superfamily)